MILILIINCMTSTVLWIGGCCIVLGLLILLVLYMRDRWEEQENHAWDQEYEEQHR
jgi:predicted histidine transporter YuiF (NhaC family)